MDSLLSEKRDMVAAQHFFRSARSMADRAPERVTTDGHDAYPRAIREALGTQVEHRDNWYLNRHLERDHRAVKQRDYPMLGFSAFSSAQRFWRAFEEVRQYLRPRQKQNERISLPQHRQQFLTRVQALSAMFRAA